MAAGEENSLEVLLNQATGPLSREDDFDSISLFCKKVDTELEGPQTSTRLLAHKIQSPQEHEALQALVVLEQCVKQCSPGFRSEIGKYRFLNELIKVVSPKYLGQKTTEKVRKKVVQLLYVWSLGLKEQTKIRDAYQMLKQQGIVKIDPDYDDTMLIPTPPPRDESNNLFKDDERQKRLEKLLKSKNPEDLQAANRLIKSVVMEDQNRMEKIQKRCKMVEEVTNNIRLLSEMLSQFDPEKTKSSDLETMKELYSGCQKLRPGLFRLASDTDDDEQALMEILRSNDDLSRVIQSYEKLVMPKVEMDRKGDGAEAKKPEETTEAPKSSLIDLAGIDINATILPSSESNDVNLLSSDLKTPATNGDLFGMSEPPPPQATSSDDLTAIFGSAGTQAQSSLMSSQSMTSQPSMTSSHTPMMMSQQPIIMPQSTAKPTSTIPLLLPPPTNNKPTSLSDIDLLSRDLMEKTLGRKPEEKFAPKVTQKPTLNELTNKGVVGFPQTEEPQGLQSDLLGSLLSAPAVEQEAFSEFLSSKPVATTTSEPIVTTSVPPPIEKPEPLVSTGTANDPAPLLPLTDVFVPLEKIKPSLLPPLTVYDKNGLRVLFHFAQDFATPERTDTLVTVVSIMSTRPAPIPHIVLQVAVPKIMRVKLQTPSNTQLQAYNPIVPSAPITQIMILANPNKKEVKLRYKFDYKLDDQTAVTETGEVTGFPPFEKWGCL